MDPCYMDTCEFDTLSIAPLKKRKKKRSYGIKLGPGLLRLVSMLGLDKSKVGGEDSLTDYF